MTRRLSLLALGVQEVLLIAIGLIVIAARSGYVSSEIGRVILSFCSALLILLSPFGVISAFMTIGLKLLVSRKMVSTRQLQAIQNNRVLMFFTWREVSSHVTQCRHVTFTPNICNGMD